MEFEKNSFEENNGGYIVLWHMVKKKPQRGLLNSLIGTTSYKKILVPIVKRYHTKDVALFSYNTLKERGYHRPTLLKIVRE